MKRLLILISMFLLVFCVFGANTSFSSIAEVMRATQYSTYTTKAVNNSAVKVANAGVFYINTVSASSISTCVNLSKEIKGESFVINNCENGKISRLQKLTKFREVKREKISNTTIVYAYSSMLKKFTFINNEKVNLQIAFDGTNLTVGYPLILGSY